MIEGGYVRIYDSSTGKLCFLHVGNKKTRSDPPKLGDVRCGAQDFPIVGQKEELIRHMPYVREHLVWAPRLWDVREATKSAFGTPVSVVVVSVKQLVSKAHVLVRNSEAFRGANVCQEFLAYDRSGVRGTSKVIVQYGQESDAFVCRFADERMSKLDRFVRSEVEWDDAFQFWTSLTPKRNLCAYDVYEMQHIDHRGGAKVIPKIRVERRTEPVGTWIGRRSLRFYAPALVRVYVYAHREYPHSYSYVSSSPRAGEGSDWVPIFSFLALERPHSGTSKVTILEDPEGRQRVVYDDECAQSESKKQENNSAWKVSCLFHAFDAPVAGTTRINVQATFAHDELYRLTPEGYSIPPWEQFRALHILRPSRVAYPHL